MQHVDSGVVGLRKLGLYLADLCDATRRISVVTNDVENLYARTGGVDRDFIRDYVRGAPRDYGRWGGQFCWITDAVFKWWKHHAIVYAGLLSYRDLPAFYDWSRATGITIVELETLLPKVKDYIPLDETIFSFIERSVHGQGREIKEAGDRLDKNYFQFIDLSRSNEIARSNSGQSGSIRKKEGSAGNFLPAYVVNRETRSVSYGEKTATFNRAEIQWKFFLAVYESGPEGILRDDLGVKVWGIEYDDNLIDANTRRVNNEKLLHINLEIKPKKGVFTLRSMDNGNLT